MKKLLVLLVVSAFVLASVSAQAYSLNFNYQGAGDGSGKTSYYGVDANNVALPGFYIETFDVKSAPNLADYASVGNVVIQPGYVAGYGSGPYSTYAGGFGGFSSLVGPNDFKVTVGSIGIRNGGVTGLAANPDGDNTFFAYAPAGPNSPNWPNATVLVDFSIEQAAGFGLDYLGLYYGSIDTYNRIDFYSGPIGASQTLIKSVTGTDILNQLGGSPGAWTGFGSNVYVNMFFAPDEQWTHFTISTTGVATEVDNIVVGRVPEPATMLLLGLGLVGLAGVGRKFKK